ncbi:MAG: hypothetical protein ACTSQY_09640 [Candidatus Odinarchaeia archaeon]
MGKEKTKVECEGTLKSFDMSMSAETIRRLGRNLNKSLIGVSEGNAEITLSDEEAKKLHDFLFNKKGNEVKIKLIVE